MQFGRSQGAFTILLAFCGIVSAKAQDLNDLGFNRYVWKDALHFNQRAKGVEIDTIVLHHTASNNLSGTIRWFRSPESKVSAHYTVGKQGAVVQMVNTFSRAWHAGKSLDAFGRDDVNSRSVGIELVNVGDGKDPYPEAQLKAVEYLIAVLMRRHPIKKITSHEFVAEPQGRKNDPINFPWNRLTRFGVPLYYGQKPKA